MQLWATKVKADIIKSEIGSDPASVAFKTAEFAKKNQIDIALIDTAGRLQNKKNLMEEYKKIINVLKKIDSIRKKIIISSRCYNGSKCFKSS